MKNGQRIISFLATTLLSVELLLCIKNAPWCKTSFCGSDPQRTPSSLSQPLSSAMEFGRTTHMKCLPLFTLKSVKRPHAPEVDFPCGCIGGAK
ncbi:hypothetical protein NL676_037753 [Syzygium grande]|nr:hypothetical protein NL676_037753 [Syzygium grande]